MYKIDPISAKDGRIKATLGKKLIKTMTLKAEDIQEPTHVVKKCKEITIIANDPFYLYIDKKDIDHRLTIPGSIAIEAEISAAWIQATSGTEESASVELWLWD